MELEKVLYERYSVRKYQNKDIEEEKLLKILDAGRIAPTAMNKQPQRVYVLKTEEAKAKLQETQKMTFGAPVVLLVCADMNAACSIPNLEANYNTAEMDVSISCTQMMLEAWNLGIGSVWVRYFNADTLKKSFALPENIKPICLLVLGYADLDSKPNEKLHNTKNTIEEMVTYL